MKWEENERKVVEYLKEHGVDREMKPFSIRANMNDIVLKRSKITRTIEEYVPKTMVSKLKWIKRLRNNGYIEVDYSNMFKPKMSLTEKGEQLLNEKV